MNCHGGCAKNARLKQAIDRVPKLKVIDPKAGAKRSYLKRVGTALH